MKFLVASLFLLAVPSESFVVNQPGLRLARTAISSASDETQVDLGLTPELQLICDAFQTIPSEELRYKQLLYMATNTEKANDMPDASKIPENKVPGCLSTVYIDGSAKYDADADDYIIDLFGESDGLLTRGLVALLLRGVSGSTAAQIQKINPEFIKVAGISQSLTPGRNNGFLNMLAVIKQKASQLDAAAREQGTGTASATEEGSSDATAEEDEPYDSTKGPKYNAMAKLLMALKPTKFELTDNSHQHAGHAGNDIDGESHFDLVMVADAFDGLSLVKRHQLIYMMLGSVMPEIHALQIRAQTPAEVAASEE